MYYYYIVPFIVTINGDLSEEGTAGVMSRKPDYRSNAIKTEAIEFYKKKYNTSKPVIVQLRGMFYPYPEDLYQLSRPNFTIEIIEKAPGLTY